MFLQAFTLQKKTINKMNIDKYIIDNQLKEEAILKMIAEIIVNVEGVSYLAKKWNIENTQFYIDYLDKLNQISIDEGSER